jgi:Family of unknown function (DUF6062)
VTAHAAPTPPERTLERTVDSNRLPAVSAADLPARSIDELRLAEDVAAGGCPICNARERATERRITALLAEGVNDVGTRARLERGRGFCATHTTRVVETDRRRSGGTLGAAILLAAVLRQRLDELAGLAASRGRGSNRRLAAAAQPPDCQICEHARQSEGLATASLVGLGGLPAWSAALGVSSFCLDHFVGSAAVAARSPREIQDRWQIVAAAQLDRLALVWETLEGFVANSSFERRSQMTADQLEATTEAAAALASSAPGSARAGRMAR